MRCHPEMPYPTFKQPSFESRHLGWDKNCILWPLNMIKCITFNLSVTLQKIRNDFLQRRSFDHDAVRRRRRSSVGKLRPAILRLLLMPSRWLSLNGNVSLSWTCSFSWCAHTQKIFSNTRLSFEKHRSMNVPEGARVTHTSSRTHSSHEPPHIKGDMPLCRLYLLCGIWETITWPGSSWRPALLLI